MIHIKHIKCVDKKNVQNFEVAGLRDKNLDLFYGLFRNCKKYFPRSLISIINAFFEKYILIIRH